MTLDAVKHGARVLVSAELLREADLLRPLSFAFNLREPLYGPLRTWSWDWADDTYLERLSADELLEEAKRLHSLIGLDLDNYDPDEPEDVEELRNVRVAVWRHRTGHPPLAGWDAA